MDNKEVLYQLYDIISDRKINPKQGSYTNYLFEKGLDKILKKVGEEAAETIEEPSRYPSVVRVRRRHENIKWEQRNHRRQHFSRFQFTNCQIHQNSVKQ